MYIRLALERINNNKKVYITNFTAIVLSLILSLVILGYFSSHQKMIYDTLIFKKDSAIVYNDSNFTQNVYLDETFSKYNLEYTNILVTDISATQSGQSVLINMYEGSIVEFGALSYDYKLNKKTVEEVEILFGRMWTLDEEQVIVIDEYTAISTFGFSNVVGNRVILQNVEYEVVGVVSATTQRENEFLRCETAGNSCFLPDFPSNVYLPLSIQSSDAIKILDYSGNEQDFDQMYQEIIIDNPESINQIVFKDKLVESIVGDAEEFYTILTVITTIVVALGFLNMMNTFMHNYVVKKLERQRLLYLGYTKKDLVFLELIETIILTLMFTVLSVILAVIVLIVVLLSSSMLIYFDFIFFIKLTILAILIVPVLMTSIVIIVNIIGKFALKSSNKKGDISGI